MPAIQCMEERLRHKECLDKARLIKQNAAKRTIKKFLDWYLVNGHLDFDTELERYIQEEIV